MILPFVREIFAELEHTPGFERVRRHLSLAAGRSRVSGLTATARALYLPLLARAAKQPSSSWSPTTRPPSRWNPSSRPAASSPAPSIPTASSACPPTMCCPFENLSPHPDVQEQRAAALWKLATGAVSILIAPVEAAALRLFDRDYYAGLAVTLKRGEEVDIEVLTAHLASVGYTQMDLVEMPGQFTRRGGILDVYSPESDRPVRIEFFGDEIETIRKFDPETQRSQSALDEAQLLPLTETPVTEHLLAAVHARLSRQRIEVTGSGDDRRAGRRSRGRRRRQRLPRLGVLRPRGRRRKPPPQAPAALRALSSKSRPWSATRSTAGGTRSSSATSAPASARSSALKTSTCAPKSSRACSTSHMGLDLDQLGAVDVLDEDATARRNRVPTAAHAALPRLHPRAHRAVAHPHGSRNAHRPRRAQPGRSRAPRHRAARIPDPLSPRQPHRAPRRRNHLDEASYLAGDLRVPVIVRTPLAAGVSFPDANLILFGANDLSDEADVAARPEPKRSKTAAFVSDFRDLTVGDYVVHVEHGIAQYQGLKEIEQDGLTIEFMILEFAEAAKLYVPLTRLDLIQKYRSTDAGPAPVLNKLGSQQWAKTKARVRKAMQDMAAELLKLYAERHTAQGNAFSPDNEFQREFEDAFDYNETDDQLSAIRAIKHDMESTTAHGPPALRRRRLRQNRSRHARRLQSRAGRQAGRRPHPHHRPQLPALRNLQEALRAVPHQRRDDLPLPHRRRSRRSSSNESRPARSTSSSAPTACSRRTSSSRTSACSSSTKSSASASATKSASSRCASEIDVLAMSATPIPRTLHMSLVGLRDMSVIETPPKDRMAIQTVVAKFDEKIVRSAVEVELERGGQVYFVHNRVESIYEIASRIQELVPAARVVVGHGQMGESELERVMLAFMHHEFDVLVATTIIENGLDIPLANTILINRADRHGLSELYQLRGRVGRSNRRAYAYLLIPPEKELTEIARRRLAALKEFSDLGAGFKIAALDLELRGAGNMLGGEQSGHIEAVGFELYTSMLEAAVKEMKGESTEERPATQLNLGIALRIDESYVPEENQRLRLYKKIAGATSEAAVAEVRAEMEDRYGALPDATVYLLEAALICASSASASASRRSTASAASCRFASRRTPPSIPQHLMRLVARNAKRGAQFTPQGVLKFPLTATRPDEVLLEIRELLDQPGPGARQRMSSTHPRT